VTVLSAAPALAQKADFIPLDATCGPAFFPTFCVVDMSADGKTILFKDKIWREATGFETIGPAGGYVTTALSDDGSTVVGDVFIFDSLGPHLEAGIWQGGDQWRTLGGLPGVLPCGDSLTSAYDVSGDGSRVVGLAWVGAVCSGAHAFEWTAATGLVDRGSIVADASSRANSISADGRVIAGWSDSSFGARLAALWTEGGTPAWLEADTSPRNVGEAIGISSDGTYVVGGGYADYTNPTAPGHLFEPWLWSEDTGVVPLGTAKGLRGEVVDGQHYARDVSDDGATVIGQTTLFNLGQQWAFLWTKSGGMKLMQEWLRENTDTQTAAKICTAKRSVIQVCRGWDFWNGAAVSNDGKIIVGTGVNPDGLFQAFMIKRP
jgi:uncharacterized membrane protein